MAQKWALETTSLSRFAGHAGNWHSLCRCEVYKKHQQTVFSTGYNWINDRWLESASWILMVDPMHWYALCTHNLSRTYGGDNPWTTKETPWKPWKNTYKNTVENEVRENEQGLRSELSSWHKQNKFRVPEYVLSFPCWSSGRVLSWLGLWTFRNFLGDWSLSFEQLYANKPNIEQPLALRMEGTLHQLKDVLSHYL